LINRGHLTDARNALEMAAGIPMDVILKNILGDLFYKLNDYENAISIYIKSIELDPDYSYPYNGLGVVYFERNDYEKALRYFKKASEVDPEHAETFVNLGAVYATRQEYKKAAESFTNIVKMDGNKLKAHKNLSNAHLRTVLKYMSSVYHELKDHQKAQFFYDTAIAIDPNK